MSLDGLDGLGPEDSFADAPDRHRLVTSGVTSRVFDVDREVVGHIVMVEYDETARDVAEADARALDGPSVLLRSSADCWHVYDLAVRPWREVVDAARSTRCCPEYRAEQIERERFALRTFPKIRRTGEVYREAPEPVALFDGARGPVSRPHVVALQQLADEQGADAIAAGLDILAAKWGTTGRTLTQTDYETRTDALAAVLDGRVDDV